MNVSKAYMADLMTKCLGRFRLLFGFLKSIPRQDITITNDTDTRRYDVLRKQITLCNLTKHIKKRVLLE